MPFLTHQIFRLQYNISFLTALLSASRPLLLYTSFTYVLASTAHLYTCLDSSPIACPPSPVFHWCIFYCVYCKTIVLYTLFLLNNNCVILCPSYTVSVNVFCHHVCPACSVFVWALCLILSNYLAWWFSVFFFDTECFSHLIFFDCLFHFSYNEFLIFLSLI